MFSVPVLRRVQAVQAMRHPGLDWPSGADNSSAESPKPVILWTIHADSGCGAGERYCKVGFGPKCRIECWRMLHAAAVGRPSTRLNGAKWPTSVRCSTGS